MKKKASNIVFLTSYIIILVGLAGYLFFNDYGLFKYFNLKSEIGELEYEIKIAEDSIKVLNEEIDSLKTSLYKIEEIAREKHHMLKKNEEAFNIREH